MDPKTRLFLKHILRDLENLRKEVTRIEGRIKTSIEYRPYVWHTPAPKTEVVK